MDEYKYQEHREKAIKNPTSENLETLAEWLFMYGCNYMLLCPCDILSCFNYDIRDAL